MKTATATDISRVEAESKTEVERLLEEMKQMAQQTAAHQSETARLREETRELLRNFKVR